MLDSIKLKNDIDTNGYTIINNFFDKKKLNHLKRCLLDILNYINFSEETDLQKKYYEVKIENSSLHDPKNLLIKS